MIGLQAFRAALAGAELVLASELTLIECRRVLVRAIATGRVDEAAAADRRAQLRQASQHWAILSLEPEVSERASRPLPLEPVRTLDALHLAFALFARSMVPETQLLSPDERIRACGKELGFELIPA